MKVVAVIFLSVTSAFAQFGNVNKLAKCDSLEVRLSKDPIPCYGKAPTGLDYDIPEHKLNLEDLEKIFQGAESSGGRLVSPMNTPRIQRDLTPFPFNLSCHAKLLSDGGKKVSFLSTTEFDLNEKRYSYNFFTDKWNHFLTADNDVDTFQYFRIPSRPNITLPIFSFVLDYNKGQRSFSWDLCELGQEGDRFSSSCSHSKFSINSMNEARSLYFKKKIFSKDFKADLTLKVSCRYY